MYRFMFSFLYMINFLLKKSVLCITHDTESIYDDNYTVIQVKLRYVNISTSMIKINIKLKEFIYLFCSKVYE